MTAGLQPNDLLGAYRVIGELGRGGMGVVYSAEHVALGRKVALKVLGPALAEDPAFRERFVRESQLQASLDHPHILPVLDAGEINGVMYVAMKFVPYSDFAALLGRWQTLSPLQGVTVLSQVAGALDAAHRVGLLHRDVKPANILVDLDNNAPGGQQQAHMYLTDFGLAKDLNRTTLTQAGAVMGTPLYMPPEQIKGERLDGRVDVYSFSCVLYQCLTGSPPYQGNLEQIQFGHLWGAIPLLGGSLAPFDPLIQKGLAKQREQRYGSCGELIQDANQILGTLPPPAEGHSLAVPPSSKPLQGVLNQGQRVQIRRWAGTIKPEETGLEFAIHADKGRTGVVVGQVGNIVQVKWDAQDWSKVKLGALKGPTVRLNPFVSTIATDWLKRRP